MLGSDTPGGVEPLIYLKRQHLTGQGGWDSNGVVEIDRSNAYNTMSLASVQESLRQHNPKNGSLFEWAYGETAYTLACESRERQTGGATDDMSHVSCLTQGDPPAAYWYQHGDRRDMVPLNDKLGDRGMALSYIDDVSILKTTTMTQDTDDPVILTAMESLTEGTINTSTTKGDRVVLKEHRTPKESWDAKANRQYFMSARQPLLYNVKFSFLLAKVLHAQGLHQIGSVVQIL